MNPWAGKLTFLLGMIVYIAIRVPHEKVSQSVPVQHSRKGALETALLGLMMLAGLLIPLIYIATPWLSFADYPLEPAAYVAGIACLALTFWLFHRAHADLGANWSASLEIRENHQLITVGIYRAIRHPMYASIFVYAIAQALLLPNWIAGPAELVAFTAMFSLRLRPEEQMMQDRFGQAYVEYRQRTKRLIPGIW